MADLCTRIKKDVRFELKGMADATKKDNLERGARFCKVRGEPLFSVSKCTGEECKVEITGNCPPNALYDIDIHTHPYGDPLSYVDITTSANADDDEMCLIRDSTLECVSNIQELRRSKKAKQYNGFLDELPKDEFWVDHYPRFKKLLLDLDLKICETEL